jgi:hypothetical protein
MKKDMLQKLGILVVVLIAIIASYLVIVYPYAKNALVNNVIPFETDEESAGSQKIMAYDTADSRLAAPALGIVAPDFNQDAYSLNEDIQQRIIKTGNLDMQVASVDTALSDITTIADQRGGFVQDSNQSEDRQGNKFGSVTVKIPADQYQATLSDIKGIASRVFSENTSGQDVTQQYYDLDSDLKNQQGVLARYQELLDQATTVDEILQVQDRINQTQREIDYITGRLQYLENQTDYSTIYVQLSEDVRLNLPQENFSFSDILKDAFQTFVKILQNFVVFVFVLIAVLLGLIPYALVVGGVIWLLWKATAQWRK